MKSEDNAIYHAFLHFYYLDKSNAAIHLAPAKFSPIVFRLAEFLEDPLNNCRTMTPEVAEVLQHLGKYPLDPGR